MVWPRYHWEPADHVKRPAWLYPPEMWSDSATALGPPHEDLRTALAAYLDAG